LGGRVLQRDDINNTTITEDSTDGEDSAQERRGLLGAWSPPDVSAPLTIVASNEIDGRLGVGLGIDDRVEWDQDASTAGGRDSGVHVDDCHTFDGSIDKSGGLPLEAVVQ
jgi:hypothetical protein